MKALLNKASDVNLGNGFHLFNCFKCDVSAVKSYYLMVDRDEVTMFTTLVRVVLEM